MRITKMTTSCQEQTVEKLEVRSQNAGRDKKGTVLTAVGENDRALRSSLPLLRFPLTLDPREQN